MPDGRPRVGILLQEPQNRIAHLRGDYGVGRDFHLRFNNLHNQRTLIACLERVLQRSTLWKRDRNGRLATTGKDGELDVIMSGLTSYTSTPRAQQSDLSRYGMSAHSSGLK